MVDYQAVLKRKIQDASEDPAKMRELVYEAARLALRRQVQMQRPALSFAQIERHISELEDAIRRLEAETEAEAAAGAEATAAAAAEPAEEAEEAEATDPGEEAVASDPGGPDDPEPEPDEVAAPGEAAANDEAGPPSRDPPAQSEEDAAFFTVGDPQVLGAGPAAPAARAAARQPIKIPERAKRPSYLVNPADFVNPNATSRAQPAPRPRKPMVISGLKVTFQLAVAAVAVAALYFAVWGRNGPVQTAGEIQLAGAGIPRIQTAPAPEPPADEISTAAAAPLPAAPPAETPVAAASAEPALPFPLPDAYGVYAVRDNQLIALEQVQATPADARTPNQLEITRPGRIVSATSKLAFLVFRRDLVSNAPEKVSVRIAARIAHSMNFDSAGQAVVTTPKTDTWLIRDKGYELRASPLRGSAEMVMLRPENPEFSFPPGRYELMLDGQAYDFVIAGEVTDPAHCVEGVVTFRGPEFYECKPVL
jgi:hypothetical protein